MSVAAASVSSRVPMAPAAFAGAIFVSAGLVFIAEPMIAKMILPQLGGSPAVWNTSMAFFQAALLVGYGYAHLLQRVASLKTQVVVHLCMLALAAVFLPVATSTAFGAPPVESPILWLLGTLAVSVGAPFAVLSATAPLLQAWFARALNGQPGADNPYILYAASNLGSMLALLAYPTIVEPLLAVNAQTFIWAALYGVFSMLIAAIGFVVWRSGASAAEAVASHPAPGAISWRQRLLWIGLAAIPSSLMLGATTYISNDVASVPLLWVIPLALYLLTFIVSFQSQPIIPRERALLWQAAFVATAAGLLCLNQTSMLADLMAYLGAFFFSALVCHQALAASRPHASRLTEFYLLMSLGGVLGGMFNAFVAPAIFHSVLEFPIVLVLACLARPWGEGPLPRRLMALAGLGMAAALAIAAVPGGHAFLFVPLVFAIIAGLAAGFVSQRALLFTLVIGVMCAQAALVSPDKRHTLFTARSFFGVHRVTLDSEPALGGELHLLFHGTTIHGAQPLAPAFHCTPTLYYSPIGPFGQVYRKVMASHPRATMGVVGLGAGSVAAYTRAGDRMRFFEIDPEVERIARDPRYFSYLTGCAKGSVDVVLGDARLTMPREQPGSYDLIQLDAFSGDSVPTHLLTTQALGIYFRILKPDGILLLHISNRNLSLEPSIAAAAKAIGLVAMVQEFLPPAGTPEMVAAPTQVMLMARNVRALAAVAHDRRWRAARDKGVRAWTDDYTNIMGAIVDHALAQR